MYFAKALVCLMKTTGRFETLLSPTRSTERHLGLVLESLDDYINCVIESICVCDLCFVIPALAIVYHLRHELLLLTTQCKILDTVRPGSLTVNRELVAHLPQLHWCSKRRCKRRRRNCDKQSKQPHCHDQIRPTKNHFGMAAMRKPILSQRISIPEFPPVACHRLPQTQP